MKNLGGIMNLQSKYWKKTLIYLVLILVFLAIVFCPYLLWKNHQSSFIDGRPAEELTCHSLSPDELHSLDVYYNGGKGATLADSTVIIISSINSGDKWKNKDKWCLYYAYRYTNVTAEWLDNKTIIVHNSDINPNDVMLDIYQNEFYP